MDSLPEVPASVQVYRYHWLAFWKALAGVSFLLVLSIAGFLLYLPLGLVLLTLALIGAVIIYLSWSHHTLTFTPGNHLVRRRGFLGCTEDMISLFGTITPYQVPILGGWLDVGSVYLGIPGPDIHIRYVAHFRSFRRRLVYGAQQQAGRLNIPPVQIVVQLPPVQSLYSDWLDQLFPGEHGRALIDPATTVQEDERPDLRV
jgi:hypothetical protein